MDVEMFNDLIEELEQAYLTHMIDRKEYQLELKELRQERQNDRDALLVPVKPPEIVKPPVIQRPLYPVHKMKIYRSRRRMIFFAGMNSRKNSKIDYRR